MTLKTALVSFTFSFLYYVFRIFPVQKNKIFFQNFNGKGYGDNPKYIAQEIIRRGLDYKLVWAVRKQYNANFPKEILTVNFKSIRAIYEESTAIIWIDNCRKQPYVRKRKKQYYIQTWHGGPSFVLKKIERDVKNSLSPYYCNQAIRDSSLVDLLISCERNKQAVYRHTFWYNGEIMESGSPCLDLYFTGKHGIKEKVYAHFNLEANTKIVLYAPTFRDNFDSAVYDVNFTAILSYLTHSTGSKWVFLVRLHPEIAGKADCITYNDSIINASHYDDVQELMLASELLISDYSGTMLEFMMTGRPIFLYAKDYNEYLTERNFYINLEELPFPLAKTNAELLQNIAQFDNAVYKIKLEEFKKYIGIIDDGNASTKVVDKIWNIIHSAL
jgi:CDP-glycerol glycerophosphotransferase